MNRPRYLAVVGIVGVPILIGLWFLFFAEDRDVDRRLLDSPPGTVSTGESTNLGLSSFNPASGDQQNSEVGKKDPQRTPHQVIPAAAETKEAIEQALQEFRNSTSPEHSRDILARLRARIRNSSDYGGSAVAIAEFLKTGEDSSTGLGFIVGTEGVMEDVPTLRTALLDLLPPLDPNLASKVSREIMDQGLDPDEYALGLRNVVWNDHQGRHAEELHQRFGAMLDRNDWLADPSGGFLEAFDVAVYLGTPEALDQVMSVVHLEDSDGQAATGGQWRAAFMALDRIILKNPSILATRFSDDPKLLDFAPNHRASVMSRLDITDPAQQQAFEDYLSLSEYGDGELDYFGELFPNGNYFFGHRLVSDHEVTPTIAQRQEMDRQMLGVVDQMLKGNSAMTGGARAALTKISERLTEYVSQDANTLPAAPPTSPAPPIDPSAGVGPAPTP